MALEPQLADDERVQQADYIGAGADYVALVREGALERAGAAEAVTALEHEDLLAGPGEVGGRRQAVVAAADDDRVPLARGELGERRRQPDLPGQRGHIRHTRITRRIVRSARG